MKNKGYISIQYYIGITGVVVSIFLFLLVGCKAPASKEATLMIPNPDSLSNKRKSYCTYFEAQLYKSFELYISKDTISILYDNIVKSTWFDKSGRRIDTIYKTKSTTLEPNYKPSNEAHWYKFDKGIPLIKYASFSNNLVKDGIRKKIRFELGKIQRFGDYYYFLNKNDTHFYPRIYIYDERINELDSLVWNGNRTEDKIEELFVSDFRADGYPDLFVFSRDVSHDGLFGITIITNSPFLETVCSK